MRLRSSGPARGRFWNVAVAAGVFVAVLFVVAPAMGVFTVPIAGRPVANHEFGTPAAVGAPTGLACTWPITANPTSVTLDWTNAQGWSTTQIQRDLNGGGYADSGSAVAAGTSTVSNTAVTTPAANQYGWRAKGVIGNWESAYSDEVTDETCKGAINKLMTGAVNARLNNVNDVAIDSLGNIYLADTNSHRIRCIAATSRCGATVGNIYTYAGDGTSGTTSTRVNGPKGLWVDQYDNLLIADSANGAVRVKLVSGSPTTLYGQTGMSAGNMYTVAGNIGTTGFAGHNISAVDSSVRTTPQDIATDSLDNLYIADGGNHRIRCVAETTKCGATDGRIYTWVGDGTSGTSGDDGAPASGRVATPTGITVNSDDSVIWTDRTGNRLRMVYAGGEGYGVTSLDVGNLYTIKSGLTAPWNVAVDDADNLLYGESTGYVSAFFVEGTTRYGITTPTDDTAYAIAGTGGTAYNGTGLPITGTGAATIGLPYGIAVNPTDATDVFAVDNGRNVLRKIDYAHGFTFTWAGVAGTSSFVADDVPAHGWEYTTLNHSTVDSDGNVYFADSGDNRIRKWIPACECLVVAAGTGSGSSNGDGSSPLLAGIDEPQGVHIDSAGNLYIAETGSHKIRMIPASLMTRFNNTNMAAGSIYTIMGNGNACAAGSAPCGDGSTLASANRLNFPRDVLVDASGNLIVSDGANCEIRFVPISTATFFGAARIANTIYNLGGTQRNCTNGSDGIAAPSSTINVSDGITLDGFGNLLLAEASGNRIRLIASTSATMYGTAMTAGHIYNFAGSTSCGTNDAVVASATFCGPRDVSYDSTTGAVYVADTGNDLIRKILSGTVTTLAGGGATDPGDTGPGRGAVLTDPAGAVIDPGGDLYVTQTGATLDMRAVVGPDP
jgi:sugar lactone lactonase YvrE